MNHPVLQTESPYIHFALFQQILQLVFIVSGSIADLAHLNIMFALLEVEEALVGDITSRDDIIDNSLIINNGEDTELDIFIDISLRNDQMLAYMELFQTFL